MELWLRRLPTCLFGVIGLDAADVRRLLGHEDLHELRQAGFELCGCLEEQKPKISDGWRGRGDEEGKVGEGEKEAGKSGDDKLGGKKKTQAEAGRPSPEHWDQCGGLVCVYVCVCEGHTSVRAFFREWEPADHPRTITEGNTPLFVVL